MGISKYKNPIILLIFYYGFLGLFFGVIAEVPDPLTVYIAFYVLFPLLALGGVFVGGYLLSPLFLYFHKKIFGGKMVYGIENKSSGKKFGKTWRGLFPGLMAITLTIPFVFNKAVQTVISQLFNLTYQNQNDAIMSTFVFLLIFMTFVSTIFFGAIWFLIDSCIIYSNSEKVKETDQPTEFKSVGSFMKTFFNGYAGIGAIIGYYIFALEIMATTLGGTINSELLILAFSFFIPFPIFLAIATLPAILFADMLRQQRINFVRKWANKFGIINYVNLKFIEVEI